MRYARAKNKSRFLEQQIFPPQIFFPMLFQYQTKHQEVPKIAWTATHINIWPQNMMYTHLAHLELGSLIFDPQKILYDLSNLLKFASVLFFTLRELRKSKVWKKSYQMSYNTRHFLL